jgi:hypothetical protein
VLNSQKLEIANKKVVEALTSAYSKDMQAGSGDTRKGE